jgi:hypothetical protein
VAVEQEAKKSKDAAAKAADKAALLALGQASASEPEANVTVTANEDKMPDAMEAAAGGAPEVMVHASVASEEVGDLSVEEQAMSGLPTGHSERQGTIAEEDDTAALAEGRATPPPQSPEDLVS